MLLRTEGGGQPQKRVLIDWGQEQIQYLRDNKVVIIRALSFEWVKQMFIMSPDKGRRLWFELISFSTPAPSLQSMLCLFKGTEIESFYRIDYYELPGIVSYSDYINLLNDGVEKGLTQAGYKCFKHGSKSEEIKMELPNGMIGGGVISKPENLDNFRALLPHDSLDATGYTQLDETPESLFTMVYKTMLEEDTANDG